MKTRDVINHFGGTQQLAAAALGMAQGSISAWGEYPPPRRQLQIELETAGVLKAESDAHAWLRGEGPKSPRNTETRTALEGVGSES